MGVDLFFEEYKTPQAHCASSFSPAVPHSRVVMLAGSMEGSADSRGKHHSATEEYHLETDFNNLHLPTFVSLASFFYFSETLVGHPLDVVRTRIQVDRTVSIARYAPDCRMNLLRI